MIMNKYIKQQIVKNVLRSKNSKRIMQLNEYNDQHVNLAK